MNLVMRGILPDNIVVRNGDTLKDDWPWFETDENKDETYDPLFVDAVVSNPPYSQNWDPEEVENDPRFDYGYAPKSKADYAFLLHDLYHLRNDGIMCIVLPHGVLFRGGEEGAIRKNLVENRNIQAIIGLPANIFFGTGIPTIVMVLRKQRPAGDDGMLIVDASKHFVKEGKNNKLRASDIKRIVDAVTTNANVDGFSRMVSIDEIRANDYNLNIPRYVDSSEAPESWDVFATMFGGVPSYEIDGLKQYWSAWPSLKDELFADNGGSCLLPKADDVTKVVNGNADVAAFRLKFNTSIEPLRALMRDSLVENFGDVDALSEEGVLANAVDDMLTGLPLVDKYDAYQELDDAWRDIAIDLEIIQTEGFESVRKVDPNMVVKKKGGKDVEVQDGWTGRILPFELVQRELFADALGEIGEKGERQSQIGQELDEILEGIDDEDKGPCDAVGDDGFVAVELKKAVKAIGKNPVTDLELALVKAQKLFDEEKKLKKEAKALRAELDEATKTAIEGLDDAQCRKLLEAKWVEPLCVGLGKLPDTIIDAFISKAKALCEKYSTTYSDVCGQIKAAEHELSDMLDELTGNEFDMAGIAELKKLLGGE